MEPAVAETCRTGNVRRLVVLAVLAGVVPAAVASGSAGRPAVLAIVNGHLGRFDAVTLQPLGRTAALGRNAFTVARSPSQTQLAVASNQPAGLRIVDARTLKTRARLALNADEVEAASWVVPRTVLVELGGIVVDGVDPVRRRVVWQKVLPEGGAYDLRAMPDGFVFLSPPGYDTIGAATLTTIDATGAMRSVLLDRIPLGWHQVDPDGSSFEERVPGLAVDPTTNLAYVVGADRTVATVDLRTLTVDYHAGSRTLAKAVSGSWRSAEWLGNGVVAVAGDNGTGAGADESTPSGLELLDTSSWTWRQVDPAAVFLERGLNALVAYDQSAGKTTDAAVYDLAGNMRFQVPGQVLQVAVASRTAYALVLSGTASRLDVLDAVTGRILRHFTKAPNLTLLGG